MSPRALYSRISGQSNLTFSVMTSSNLVDWTASSVISVRTSSPLSSGNIKYVQETVAVPFNAPIAFFKLDANWTGSEWKEKILLRNSASGALYFWYMYGTNLLRSVEIIDAVGLNWELQPSGDLDGDSDQDLVWRNSNDGSVWFWLMDGIDYVVTNYPAAISTNWQIAAYSQTDVEDGIGYIAVVTNPLLLRSGHATKLLHEAEQRLANLGVRKLIAAIETDHSPSIALFTKTGYNRIEGAESEPGFVDYEKDIQQANSHP